MLELTARWLQLNPEKVKENPRIGESGGTTR